MFYLSMDAFQISNGNSSIDTLDTCTYCTTERYDFPLPGLTARRECMITYGHIMQRMCHADMNVVRCCKGVPSTRELLTSVKNDGGTFAVP